MPEPGKIRCAELAAALGQKRLADLADLTERCECDDLPMTCGACPQREHLLRVTPDCAAILAAEREKARREGNLWAFKDAELTWRLLRGEPYAPGRFPGDEMAKYLKQRIAALEVTA